MEPPISHLGSPALSLRAPLPTFQPSEHHTPPVTSVHDIGTLAGHGPVTSIHDAVALNHPAVTSVQDLQGLAGHAPVTSVADLNHHTETSQGAAHGEDSRYSIYDTRTSAETSRDVQSSRAHRQAVHEHAKVEKFHEGTSKKDPYEVHLGGVGQSFRKTGLSRLGRRMSGVYRANKGAYNFSKDDKQFLEKMLEEEALSKTAGHDITRLDRKAMRQEAWKRYKGGEMGRENYDEMERVINELQK